MNCQSTPSVCPGPTLDEQVKWWSEWVDFVRDRPGQFDLIKGQRVFWGKHLFLGWETHKELARARRAVGVPAGIFTDCIEYEEVADLRTWKESDPAPLLLDERMRSEHVYICGPTGTGKTSQGILSLVIQQMRGSKTESNTVSDPIATVVLDFKGDPVMLHTVREEALRRGQTFRFFTVEKDCPTSLFNPFRGFDRELRTINQLCQLILDALNLNHGKGYGRSYYTERSRHLLSLALKRHPLISSFEELHTALRATVSTIRDTRAKNDAFELLSVIEMLTDYPQLVTGPEEDLSNKENVIFMPRVIRDREVVYFWLPAAMESIAVGEIGKLALFNLRVAAQDWKRNNPGDPRQVSLVVDEAQHVVGENVRGVLQDARAFGIGMILANQNLKDLRSPTGFDLAPSVMTNTRVKLFFKAPEESECYVYVERSKGFTTARQFPEPGNPWLRDLSPEELAYHVRLSWPFSYDEYKRREATPLPSWADIPGGDWRKTAKRSAAVPIEMEEPSDILPHEFRLIRDEEWTRQVAAIRGLFSSEDGDRSFEDEVIQDLLFEGAENPGEDDAEE